MELLRTLLGLATTLGILLLSFGIAYLLAEVTDNYLQLVDFALDEGHLLSGWYRFIATFEHGSPKLFKVLGGCIVCSGFWLSLAAYHFAYARYLYLGLPVLVIYQALVVGRLVRRARKQQAAQKAELLQELATTAVL